MGSKYSVDADLALKHQREIEGLTFALAEWRMRLLYRGYFDRDDGELQRCHRWHREIAATL